MVVSHGALRAYARSFLRLASEREYRRVSALSVRYLLAPRRKPGSIRIAGRPFAFSDAASFLSAYEEIFADRSYAFQSETAEPLILDLGANVGVSVLWFKLHYPGARVIAYEPDREIFAYLRRNVATFALERVELHNAAVWTENTTLGFVADGADGGRLHPGTTDGSQVEARSIREVMDLPRIDFLKMDIEGAENVVLPVCRDLLPRVRNVFIEYHSRSDSPQRLDRIVCALSEAGFRLAIGSTKQLHAPLLRKSERAEFDLQLNVFGFRP